MTSHLTVLSCAVALGCVFSACPPAPCGGTNCVVPLDGGGSVSVAPLCHDYVGAVVDRQVRCGEVTSAYASDWKAQTEQRCLADLGPGLKDGRVLLDVAGVTACIEAAKTEGCLSPRGECSIDRAFQGTVGLDGDCFSDVECTSAFFCELGTRCPGRCKVRLDVGQAVRFDQRCVETAFNYEGVCTRLAQPNQSCAPLSGSFSWRQCAEPSVCLSGQTCGPAPDLSGAGENCFGTRCGQGLVCVNGTCTAVATLGQPCSSTGAPCQFGLLCDSQGVCVDATPQPVGGACNRTTRPCVTSAFCNGPSSSAEGTCVARGGVGAACTSGADACTPGLVCDVRSGAMSGLCVRRKGVGELCFFDGPTDQCDAFLFCTGNATSPAGMCAAQRGSNQPCTRAEECLSNFCNGTQCSQPGCFDTTP